MRPLLALAALAIIVPTAIVQGRWSGRWSTSEAFDVRLAAMRKIPMKIGQWTGKNIEPEARTWERAGVAGGLMRRYEAPDGSVVTMMIVCGLPGPTSVHTPEVCYAGAGYEPATPRTQVAIPRSLGPGDEFWSIDFLKQDTTTPEYLRIFHAWSTDGRWHASTNPRADFAGSRSLYKLYFVRSLPRLGVLPRADSAIAFMHQCLPEIAVALRSPD